MIYVSSSCVKQKKIKDSVQELVDNGFKNIELSGGTEYYDGFEDDLLEQKEKYNLNYVCHNYYPPPKKHFVLNLASLNDEIYEKSFNHIVEAIELSKKLGAKRYGFHAGFFIDIKVSEIGKKISKNSLFDKQKAMQRFCDGFEKLQILAGNVKLYVENNVFSSTNYETYNGDNIFMLTSSNEYDELKNKIDFNLLLDVAHLKVSSKTLGLDFEDELKKMIAISDYIHISDNDALHDLNHKLQKDSSLVELLKQQSIKNKDFTLEIYDDLDKIRDSYTLLGELIS
ncbi:MAG: TIM barrel protein [Campylobacterota bacterium]